MAVPASLQTYPANNDTGIPIGISLEVIFDRGIDLLTAQDHVVLYGDDFDQTSGPDQALWVDSDTGNNPYFLRSPGFKGLVELTASVVYVDLDTAPTYTEVSPGTITGEVDETGYGVAGAGHKLILTPREQLAPDTTYTWHVLGDPDTIGVGISSRTVFDVEPDGANSSATGFMSTNDSYSGSVADRVVVEITTSGDIGTAKYRWYYVSAGVGSAITGVVTSRRFRRLIDGLQVNFSGSGFVSGDLYDFNVEPSERLAANFIVTFTTNDGTYTSPPSSPSTPATSTPPATILPPAPGASVTSSALTVTDMVPINGSYQNSKDNRTITLTFSDTVDAATVTDTTVRVYKYPVSGVFDGQPEVVELEKTLVVAGDQLTIQI